MLCKQVPTFNPFCCAAGFCFVFESQNHQLHSYNSKWCSAPISSYPSFLPSGGSCSLASQGGSAPEQGGEQSPSPAVACYLIAVHSARNGEKLHRDFRAVFFFSFFSLQDMSLQFEQGLHRQSGSLQMIIKGDVLTVNTALLLGLSACPSSAHLLLINLRQTYLGPVAQVFLSYMCHSTLFLAKMNAAKCFRVGKCI